ncbi:MAG: hypothetical protein ACRD0K_06575 [Egibacteraceae bacterium]
MRAPKAVHVSGFDLTEARQAEIKRIFGPDVEIIHQSPVRWSAVGLRQAIVAAQPDAVVLATAVPRHRRAIEELQGDMAILRPMYERVRNHRGEVEERHIGFGLLHDEGQIQFLADGALTDPRAIQQLTRQHRMRAQLRRGE